MKFFSECKLASTSSHQCHYSQSLDLSTWILAARILLRKKADILKLNNEKKSKDRVEIEKWLKKEI